MAIASKAAAQAAGLGKEVTKALSGYPGIFRHLAGEHAEVATLLKRVAGSSEDSKVRDEFFPEIRTSLLAHAHAEEAEFYEALRVHPQLEEIISTSRQEHEQIEKYLQQLDSGNKQTKTWSEVFDRLVRTVEKHVEREENELFPQAKELTSSSDADTMLERYEALEQQEKDRAS